MRIPIAGGSDKDLSVVVSAARSINCHVELASAGSKVPYYLVGTPGYVLFATAGTGPMRGLWEMGGVMYAVSGDGVYKATAGGVVTELGTLNTVAGRVGIADNGVQIIIVDGPYGYIYDASSGVFEQITDPDFPGATHVGFLDGYFVFAGNDEGRFGISALNDGTSFDALDFATAESDPDDTVALIIDHREAWLFGASSAEPWQNTGAADFPFERVGGGASDLGIVARHSLVRMDNSIYWLAQDRNGFQGVAKMAGYTPRIISSDALTHEISRYRVISDAEAFAYTKGLRHFYVLNFPTEGRTWVYDASIQDPVLAWHEWRSEGLTRHRARCHVYFNHRHYVGDYQSGKIYRLAPEVYTDDGETIRRERIRSFSSGDGNALQMNSVEALFESGVGTATGQGANPQAMLQISRDGGRTYANELWRSLGRMGAYRKRARWLRLGQGRDVALKIAFTDPAPFRLIDAYAEVERLTR